jgi:hypothetical protein
MTNPTPHGQVPEALIDLIDAYAETRHRCGGIYNAKTEAARKAVIEALSGVQALSAAPAGFVPVAAFDRLHAHAESLAARLLAASPTPPAEQQATTGAALGVQPGAVYAELPEHVAEVVDPNQGEVTSMAGEPVGLGDCLFTITQLRDFADRTNALRMQAAPKAAPGEPNTVPAEWLEQAYREGWAACRDAETIGEEAEDWAFGNSTANSRMIDAQQAAPGEPEDSDGFGSAEHWKEKAQYWAGVAHRLRGEALRGEPVDGIVQPPAPQPEPAPLSDDTKRIDLMDKDAGERVVNLGANWYTRQSYGQPYRKHKNLRAAIDAAMVAQKGTP